MDVAQVRKYLEIGVVIGTVISRRTETKVDDKAVEIATLILANDALLELLVKLLGGDKVVALSSDEQAVAAALPAVALLVELGKLATEE